MFIDRTILRPEWREVVPQEVFFSMIEYYNELKEYVEEGFEGLGEEIIWDCTMTNSCVPPLKKPVLVPEDLTFEDVAWVGELVDWLAENVPAFDNNFAMKLLSVYDLGTIKPAPEVFVKPYDEASLLVLTEPFCYMPCWPDEIMQK